jgi:glycosyltransferase involved in cell wall biosynthesis
MGRIRVCQLITELAPAGAERCVYELATRLDKDRFDVRVVALRGGQVADWLARAAVPVTVLGLRGKRDALKLGKLTEVLRSQQFDLVHTHLFHADLAGRPAARLAAVPHIVHTVHVAEGRFRPWQFAYARFLSGYCDRIVCVSQAVRDHHAKRSGLPLWRYVVIPNGIDAEAFSRDEASRRRLRAEWGIDGHEVLLAFVGRLDRQKGIDTLLAAISHLGARGCPMKLVVAGEGPKRPLVENFIERGEGGRFCRMLGFVTDIRGMLSAADALVMPSRWEGFGLAAGEAMAAGLPVIATRVAGLSEIVVDGQTGILVDREDVVGLADAITRLAGDAELRCRLGEAARRRVIEHYSISANIAAHQALYAEVAGDAATPLKRNS